MTVRSKVLEEKDVIRYNVLFFYVCPCLVFLVCSTFFPKHFSALLLLPLWNHLGVTVMLLLDTSVRF